jgi:lysophospholipase L1-like esterase
MRTLVGTLPAFACLFAVGCTAGVTSNPTAPVTPVTPISSVPVTVPTPGVVAWGDSMTQGDHGNFDVNNYPTQLGALLTIPVVNGGVNGNTSTQIAVRESGVPAYATVVGEVIPASGGVQVTFPTGFEPVTAYGPVNGTPGTILGAHGVVTFDSATSEYVFTRSTAGSAVTATGLPQFVVDTPYANYLPVFWEGRNNYGAPGQIISDLKAQLATIPPGQDYLVLSITNDEKASEWRGGADYSIIVNDNNQIQALAGSHYLDIREILVNSYDPTQANDVSDFSQDEVPTSLRAIVAELQLAQAVGPNDTTVYVTPASSAGTGGNAILAVDTGANAENMYMAAATECLNSTMPQCSGHNNQDIVTVQRGYEGNQTSHAAGTVALALDPVHLNGKGTGIVAQAVATYLSAYRKP